MKYVRKIGEVAGWTFFSRILGLIRDSLLFASLGTGLVNSAFIVAFTIPNLFRRLLGEGALTSSSIPVLSEVLAKQGQRPTFDLLNAILLRLLFLLGIIQLLGMISYFGVSQIGGLEYRWYLGADYGRWLFPYMLFVCLSALICGMLNVLDRFGIAAMNQVWLNLAMIVAFLIGIFFVDDLELRGRWVVGAVLVGGVFQLVIPSIALRGSGWKFKLESASSNEVNKVITLFLPSILGAAIFQVNILISRLLAFSLDESSAGILYLANRLVELPLGVFAIAIGTVLFPRLSREFASENHAGFSQVYGQGLKFIFMITVPAAIGLIFLRNDIIEVLFAWGLFERKDVLATAPVLAMAALGLPFFAWSGFLVRAYYAQQRMKVPVRLAGVNLVLNLVLSVWLMRTMGVMGLALANTLAGIVHCALLHFFLRTEKLFALDREVFVFVFANLLLSGSVLGALTITSSFQVNFKVQALMNVGLTIPLAVIVYFSSLYLFKYAGFRQITASLFSKKIN